MRQAYQHTLVGDVAAAPVIDVGTIDRTTDHVLAGCVLRHGISFTVDLTSSEGPVTTNRVTV